MCQLFVRRVKREIKVKEANDETVSFLSSKYEIGLESVDGKVYIITVAQSAKNIC